MIFLLRSGSNVNSRDISGSTAIHRLTGNFASKLTHRLAHILITEFGADINATNRIGDTPLSYAVALPNGMPLKGQIPHASRLSVFVLR
jgi:ankyrin repeat protein